MPRATAPFIFEVRDFDMTVKLDFSAPKKKIKEPLVVLAETAAFAISGRYLRAGASLIKAWSVWTPKDMTVGQAAAAFWQIVFTEALTSALRRNHWARMTDEEIISTKIWDLFSEVFASDQTENAEVTQQDLIEPTNFCLYAALREQFASFVKALEPQPLMDEEAIRRELDKALRAALERTWLNAPDNRYREFAERLEGSVAEGVRRRRAWGRHADWIRKKIEVDPMFGQEETGITVRDVYTPLRCCWHTEIKTENASEADDDLPDERLPRRAHIRWFEDTLHEWLDDDSASPLRVVAGSPGSGKSTVARIFASSVAERGDWNVCFVELQRFSLVKMSIEEAFEVNFKRKREGRGLGGDPLEWSENDGRKLMIVFDGLDELARTDKTSEDLAKSFIGDLKRFLKDQGSSGRVRAIALGRQAAVEPACREAKLEAEALLHVLPLAPLTDKILRIEEIPRRRGYFDERCVDPQRLKDRDSRILFWKTWCRANGQDSEEEPRALGIDALDELTSEPLLFYLLTISGFTNEKADEAVDNRNAVYNEIFKQVYDRDARRVEEEQDRPLDLSETDFFWLMECFGLAAWHGGGRSGSDDEFHETRKQYLPLPIEKKFRLEDAARINSVAMQFYARSDIENGRGFEFVHKSFGEYMVARALLSSATRFSENLNEHDFAIRWLKLAGNAEIDIWIVDFLRNEALFLNIDKVSEIKDQLTEIMIWVIRHGMPAHELQPDSWHTADQWQRQATVALLAVLNALARTIEKKTEKIDNLDQDTRPSPHIDLCWPSPESPKFFLENVRGMASIRSISRKLLEWINFSKIEDSFRADSAPQRVDLNFISLLGGALRKADLQFSDLLGANLQATDLKGANLRGANLRGANLRGANLQGTNLQGANLQDANLRGENLQGANLRGANLRGANLQGTNLQGANLRDANLRGENLQGANLQGANLQGANLQGANLQRANLQNTNLRLAKVSSTKFSGALLASVDMSSVRSLDKKQINSAYGDGSTKLPEHLSKEKDWPTHWPRGKHPPEESYEYWRDWLGRDN